MELPGQLLAALRPLAMRGHALDAVQDGRPLRVHAGLALQQMGEVQMGGSNKTRLYFGLGGLGWAVSRTSW
jgi:hypothetical protein